MVSLTRGHKITANHMPWKQKDTKREEVGQQRPRNSRGHELIEDIIKSCRRTRRYQKAEAVKEGKGTSLVGRRSGWESVCLFRGHEFGPWSRRIPHPVKQLSPCHDCQDCAWNLQATATEACVPQSPCSAKIESHHNDKPVHRSKECLLLVITSRESPRPATKTQCSQ